MTSAAALPAAERQHGVEHADPGRLRDRDRWPRQRRRRRPIDGPALAAERRTVVERCADAIDHAAEQVLAAPDRERRAGAPHAGRRRDPRDVAERQHHRLLATEPDHLGGQRLAVAAIDPHDLAERDAGHRGADDEPDDLVDRTDRAARAGGVDRGRLARRRGGPPAPAPLARVIAGPHGLGVGARGHPLGLHPGVLHQALRELGGVAPGLGDLDAYRLAQPVGLGAGVVDELLRERARVVLVAADHAPGLHRRDRITARVPGCRDAAMRRVPPGAARRWRRPARRSPARRG